ncbi:MAG: methionine gamma-lyase family protein, partial [Acutalibacteraceae bacterium]|nr:methionine gamma-lyase family protein [Acutalibacteraceae bacterium]
MENKFFNINEKLLTLDNKIINETREQFGKIDEIAQYNQQKVLSAFINNRVSEAHLGISTGYGYDDIGRETLEKLWAECMGAEDSLIRHNFVSGTHTLTVALFGILRPNDKMLCLTGRPYDTLIGVLGIDKHVDGSLTDFGVKYNQVELTADGLPDEEAI